MKSRRNSLAALQRPCSCAARTRALAGFSLLEMIGVLAIMAIMASVIVPNALRSLDRAAIRAEESNLDALGEQVKLYLRDKIQPPPVPNWTTELAGYADLNPSDLLTNKRGNTRIYVVNAATQRVMLLSSMRTGLGLPDYAQINGNFGTIWDTPAGSIPAGPGWGAWSAANNDGDYLVIERVNLTPVYASDLRTLPVALNNNGAASVSCRHTSVVGSIQIVDIPAGGAANLSTRPGDIIDLYTAPGASGPLDYTYAISDTGKSFDFDGTRWLPH